MRSRAQRAVPVTRADIFVSPLAGGAGDRCVLTHHAKSSDLFAINCFPLSQPVADVNRQDFAFEMPLPPRPTRGGLVIRHALRPAPGGIPAGLRVTRVRGSDPPVLSVRVLLTGDPTHPGAPLPTGFAGSIWAGWANDPTPMTHVRVHVTGAVIRNALQRVQPISPKACGDGSACDTDADCSASGDACMGAGAIKAWQLQVGVDGEWTELPGLESVSTGDVVPEEIVYDQYLPRHGALRLQLDGVARECITTMFGKSLLTDIQELGLGIGIECLNSTEHSVGTIDVSYPGPDFGSNGSGSDYETVTSGGEGGACSTTTDQACVVDADCPGIESCVTQGGAAALRYRIEKLP